MSARNGADDRALIEGSKLMFETMKHLTTLSIGSILILVGLLENVFKAPHWKAMLTISFLGFCVSNLMAVRHDVLCGTRRQRR